MYIMMVVDTPIDFQLTVFFDEVCHKSAQFPPYLGKNAVSILNGVSISNIKTEALEYVAVSLTQFSSTVGTQTVLPLSEY